MNAFKRVIDGLRRKFARLTIKPRLVILGVFLVAAVVTGVLGFSGSEEVVRDGSATAVSGNDVPHAPVDAFPKCRDALLDELATPSSADFDVSPVQVEVSPGRWHIAGQASARRASGIAFDFVYGCAVTESPAGMITVVESGLDQVHS